MVQEAMRQAHEQKEKKISLEIVQQLVATYSFKGMITVFSFLETTSLPRYCRLRRKFLSKNKGDYS
jgi:hypothetical protein